MSYNTLIFIHLFSTILMLGVGGGSAFYKFMSDKSKNLEVIVHTNKMVVLADYLFTTPSAIIQPISGYLLMQTTGYSLSDNWLVISLLLYAFAGILWLIAVYLQIKMKQIALQTQAEKGTLGESYYVLVKHWVNLGIFSFLAVVLVFWFMVFKG